MPLVLKDRVQETSTTVGTGAYTLAGAVQGYQSFSVIGNGNSTYYVVTNNTDWEVGVGTYTASGTTLSRDLILESSNSGNAVNWGAGTKSVFVSYPAERAVIGAEGLVENSSTINQNYTINSGYNAMSAGPVSIASGVTVTVPSGSVWTIV